MSSVVWPMSSVVGMSLIVIGRCCRLSLDRRKPSLDVAYRFYDDVEGGLTNEQRWSGLEHVVVPMLQAADDASVTEFFTDHIHSIVTCIETPRTDRVSTGHIFKTS